MTIEETLEAAQGDYFWAPRDVRLEDRPELRYAYCAGRPQTLYNCVLRVRPRGLDAERLVAEVSERHAHAASRWNLNALGDTPALRAALGRAGYREVERLHSHVICPADYRRAARPGVTVRRVTTVNALRELYEVVGEVFASDRRLPEADLAREVTECTGDASRVARFVAFIDGEPVGAGGITFFPALDFAFIWAGGVRASFRGRGAYTALLRARLALASQRHVRLVGLYARDATSGPIVAAHGFTRHGPLYQWDRPAPARQEDPRSSSDAEVTPSTPIPVTEMSTLSEEDTPTEK